MTSNETNSQPPAALKRELGLPGAIVTGLGAILGTGVFVALGLGAGIAGPAVLLAIVIAFVVASFNGLSSAQLAACHPVSGGTYEYGYRFLTPASGFSAGLLFLTAKSASAAAAALGAAHGLLAVLGVDRSELAGPLAAGLVVLVTALVISGIRRSTLVNGVLVGITAIALAVFVVVAFMRSEEAGETARFSPFFAPVAGRNALVALLEASALIFVAYTGYGRVATLGEEIREPRRTIPIAVVLTLAVSMIVYVAVAGAGVLSVGAARFGELTRTAEAPLQAIARQLSSGWLAVLLAVGAVAAMLGVLLNLVLGLSRVVLAMGRRRDLPFALAHLHTKSGNPNRAVLLTGLVVLALTLVGSFESNWSLSAFTVLVYYALTNLAALRVPAGERFVPRLASVLGLACCLALACFVDWRFLAAGAGIVLLGLIVRAVLRPRGAGD